MENAIHYVRHVRFFGNTLIQAVLLIFFVSFCKCVKPAFSFNTLNHYITYSRIYLI